MKAKNPPRLPSLAGLGKYVQSDLFNWMLDVKAGLSGRLNFNDNFQSFAVENIIIPPGETALISNALNVIPNERYIIRQTGNGIITDGNWDINALRLVNNGPERVTISVRFFYV